MVSQHIALRTPLRSNGLGRLTVALLLSVNFHLYLLYGFPLNRIVGADRKFTILSARINIDHTARAALQNTGPSLPPTAANSILLERRVQSAVQLVPPDTVSEPVHKTAAFGETLEQGAPKENPVVETVSERSEEDDLKFVPDFHYYSAAELDGYPLPIDKIDPVRPSGTENILGLVTLRVLIDETGLVTDIRLANADPPGTFDDAALEAFQRARFHPALKDGRAVRSQVLIKVAF